MLPKYLFLFLFFLVSLNLGPEPALAKSSPEFNKTSKQLVARRRRRRKRTTKKKTARPKATQKKYWYSDLKIPYKSWLPKRKPSKVLLCVHGLGFNSKSFTGLGRYMAARGIAVYAIDVRGFGAWRRGPGNNHVDFEACISDLETALRTIRSNLPGAKIYLVGESMGGAIALSTTSRYPDLVDGLISSVPSGARYGDSKEKIIVGAHYIENKNAPMDLSSEVIGKATADKSLQNKLERDPNIRMDLTPDELKQFNSLMRRNKDYAALIERIPVLMMAGFEDRLVKPKGTIALFNEISSEHKMLFIIGDGEHLLLEESQLTRETASLVYNWIINH